MEAIPYYIKYFLRFTPSDSLQEAFTFCVSRTDHDPHVFVHFALSDAFFATLMTLLVVILLVQSYAFSMFVNSSIDIQAFLR